MSLEVYINGQLADINNETKISETKQVNDFFEIKDRQTSRTNTFKLPMTPRNVLIFQMLGIVGSNTLMPYRIATIEVKRNGISTVENGSATIKETVYGDHYNVYSYDGNLDLYGRIEQLKIAELDFSDIDTNIVNSANWLASLTNTWVDGFIFPLADYGHVDDVIECNYQAPSLFVKYLWNKIFTEAGFNFEYIGANNIFESAEFQDSVITITEGFSNETDVEPEVKKLEISKIGGFDGNSYQNPYGRSFEDFTFTPSSNSHYLQFNEIEDPDNIHISSESPTYQRSRIRIQESGYYRLNLLGNISAYDMESLSLYVERNGVNFINAGYFQNGNIPLDFTKYIYLEEGEEVFVKFYASYKNSNSNFTYNLQLFLYLNNSQIVLNFNQYYSDINQKDFLKDVIHHYGLMFQRKGNMYQFISIEDILTNQDTVEDWSSKFNTAISEDYQIGNYAQNNYFRYSYDEDNVSFADASFKIDDRTLEDQKTLLTRLFKAPVYSNQRILNRLLRSCPLWDKTVDDLGIIKEIKPRKSKPFLMRLDRVNGSLDYKFFATGNVENYNGSIPFGTFKNMDHNQIMANKYAAFSNMLNLGKKIIAEIYLTDLDIYNLQFLRLKYIKQLGQLVYLNKVNSYNGKEVTKCELIRVRRFVNKGEYNDDYNQDYNI